MSQALFQFKDSVLYLFPVGIVLSIISTTKDFIAFLLQFSASAQLNDTYSDIIDSSYLPLQEYYWHKN